MLPLARFSRFAIPAISRGGGRRVVTQHTTTCISSTGSSSTFCCRRLMATTTSYADSWEKFWGSVSKDNPQDVLWNSSHDEAVAIDWQHMEEHFTTTPQEEQEELPLVDIGCGDGTQTQFFRGRVKQAIGVDISQAAVDIANARNDEEEETDAASSSSGAETTTTASLHYQVLDLMNRSDCEAFHDTYGDANLYMRGVLMQFSPTDRVAAANNIHILMGTEGHLYAHEYVPETFDYYGSLFQKQGIPMGFQRVMDSGITPGGIARDEMEALFADYQILKESDDHKLNTIIELEGEGDVARAPGFYMVLKRKSSL